MAQRALYPVFLDIAGRLAVVIGAGKVGLRKARGLVQAGASVRVISPRFEPGFDDMEVERVPREYAPGDLEGAFLAFAATDNRDVNRAVGDEARASGIAANIADAPDECGFMVPARVTVEGVQIAISTGGVSPRRAAALRKRIEALLSATE